MNTSSLSDPTRDMNTSRRSDSKSEPKKEHKSKSLSKSLQSRKITKSTEFSKSNLKMLSPCVFPLLWTAKYQKSLAWRNYSKWTKTPGWSRSQPRKTKSECHQFPSKTYQISTLPWKLRPSQMRISQNVHTILLCKISLIAKRIRNSLSICNWKKTWAIRALCRRRTQ